MIEEWRVIEEFPGYEISNYGRVRSTKRKNPILLKNNMSGGANNNYKSYRLYKDKKPYSRKAHHLVLWAFVGPMPEDMNCRLHLDDDYLNNRVDNLAYGTLSQNSLMREARLRKRKR